MSDQVRHVNTDAFTAEVLEGDRPVLVDFYADWCGPCKVLGPSVEAVAREYAGRVSVRKVDVDVEPELAGRFGVRGLPTLMVFKNGEPVETLVGVAPKSRLIELLERHLG